MSGQRLLKFFRTSSKSLLRSAAAAISKNGDDLLVEGEQYPLIWLRDNCTCAECYHKSTRSRMINWADFNVDVKAKSLLQERAEEIAITWNDGHESVYDLKWLRERSFAKQKQREYLDDVYVPKKKLWGPRDFFDVMKAHEYEEVMNNDVPFYKWLMDLAVYGVVLMRNAPRHHLSECRNLLNKIAFVRRTHYGEDFHVAAKKDAINFAYLSNTLQLHTDLPYYDYKPGVNILHCIVQTQGKGGENLLTDAFYVAEKLRAENEGAFRILADTEVNWRDAGTEDGFEFNKIHRAPVISLDRHGALKSIRHSITVRDSYFTADLDRVKPWYNALKIFVEALYKNAAEFKTEPGDVLAFDNTRLVHGRASYEDSDQSKRLLIGHYVDWDEIYSRIRVLRNKISA